MSQWNTHHLEQKKKSKEQIVINIKTIKKQANDTSGQTKTTQDRNKNNPNHSTDKTDTESSLEYSSSDESINTQTKNSIIRRRTKQTAKIQRTFRCVKKIFSETLIHKHSEK
jgi:hypothetical protein